MAASHDWPGENVTLTSVAGAVRWVLVSVAATLALSWIVTGWTAPDYNGLVMMQLAGAAPMDMLLFLILSGVMMVAMMLPSALPMVGAYGRLAAAGAGRGEGRLCTGIFSAGYFLLWTVFAAVSLVVLAALGFMGDLPGLFRFVPGGLLVAMGLYQLTAWKQFCLRQCRTPAGFVITHWRAGRRGALRMGLHHAAYCLGCCWLLMLVLFVAGAMSLLWMAVFAVLILAEKIWTQGELFPRAIGGTGVAVGSVTLVLAGLGL